MPRRRREHQENPNQLGLPLLDGPDHHGAEDRVSDSWLKGHRIAPHEPVEEDDSGPPTRPAA